MESLDINSWIVGVDYASARRDSSFLSFLTIRNQAIDCGSSILLGPERKVSAEVQTLQTSAFPKYYQGIQIHQFTPLDWNEVLRWPFNNIFSFLFFQFPGIDWSFTEGNHYNMRTAVLTLFAFCAVAFGHGPHEDENAPVETDWATRHMRGMHIRYQIIEI